MLIGFCGKRTAGKTHAAQILVDEYGFQRAKFAEAIKASCRDTFGLTVAHTDGEFKEKPTELLGGKAPRDAMEWLGEGAREQFGKDIWVRMWFARHSTELQAGKHFVLDDVRNPTEADAIRAEGGKVIRIFNAEAEALPILPSERELHLVKHNIALVNDLTPLFDDALRALMGHTHDLVSIDESLALAEAEAAA